MNCSDCSAIEPVEDEGELKLRPWTAAAASVLKAAGVVPAEMEGTGSVTYTSRRELIGLLEVLDSAREILNPAISFSITGQRSAASAERWFSLDQLKARFASDNLITIIANHDFCSHMQPIVNFREEIVAFELLLRPLPQGSRFQPHELFETASRTGFHSFLDRAARISAIETSARFLPKGIKRFINFLPSSIYNPKYCLTHTFEAIYRLDQDPQDFVFEVVETEKISDVAQLRAIFAEYRKQGMLVALDDVGAGHSTVGVLSSLEPDYVKIDRGLISFCDQDPGKQHSIREIMNRASACGAKVLAEGIERREEFLFCSGLGMDLAQGYLFGRPESKPPAHFGYSA